MTELELALHEIERLREWIVMANNQLECKDCQKCINLARSYLQQALKPRNKRRRVPKTIERRS